MTVTARLGAVIFDAADIDRLAAFYADLTGWPITDQDSGWATLATPDGQEVAFQLAPDHLSPQWPGQERPQQFHLDLFVEGRETTAERAIALGATRLADGPTWITLADPAGHPFDLCEKEGTGSQVQLFAATIDTPDARGLARFYADLLGMEVTYDGVEGSLIAGGGRSLMFQQVGDYSPPQWPDPAHPQQAHLDLVLDDLDAGEARAVELGATRLEGGGKTFRVFADPSGHPFCLCRS
jgi:catechol-2,3-dioxygenase